MPRSTVPSAYVVLQGPDGQEKEILGCASSLEGAKVIGEQLGSRKPIGWDQTTPCYWWGSGTDVCIVQTQWWG